MSRSLNLLCEVESGLDWRVALIGDGKEVGDVLFHPGVSVSSCVDFRAMSGDVLRISFLSMAQRALG